jgi:hypothetical protein
MQPLCRQAQSEIALRQYVGRPVGPPFCPRPVMDGIASRDARPCVSSAHRDDAARRLIWITPCKRSAARGCAVPSPPTPKWVELLRSSQRRIRYPELRLRLARGYPHVTPAGVLAMRHGDARPCVSTGNRKGRPYGIASHGIAPCAVRHNMLVEKPIALPISVPSGTEQCRKTYGLSRPIPSHPGRGQGAGQTFLPTCCA